MDFSESYISMCNKAKEIQKIAVKPNGDPDQGEYFHCLSCKNRLQEDDGPHGNYYFCHCDGDSIWLPRQDQLQEMGSLLCNYKCQILKFLTNWIKDNKILISNFGSMEQLWLAFVMDKVFSKQWNGKDWVKL